MKKQIVSIIVIVFLFITYSFGKQNGSISGQIIDSKTANPLIGVNIILENTDLGGITDSEGYFHLTQIPPLSYNIRFSMIGYSELKKLNVEVHPGNQTNLNIELEQTIIEGEEITVTASAFHKSKGAVVSERSIDLGEIRMNPASMGDIQRSVQVLPSVSSGSDQMNEIIVRGGMPGENLFLIDDIEIPNPNHFGVPGSGGGPVNLINAEFVQNIDFYAGAYPAMFGDKASSVMNIQFREGAKKLQGTIDLNMAGVGGSIEGPISNKGSYIATYHKSYLDLILKNVGLTAIPYYWNAQMKAVYQLSQKNKLIINGVYGDDNITIDAEESDSWSRGAEFVDVKDYTYAVGTTLLTNWNKKSFSKLTLYQNAANYRYNVDKYVRDSVKIDQFDGDYLETETAVKFFYSKVFSSRFDMQFGAQAKNIDLDYSVKEYRDTLYGYIDDTTKYVIKTYEEEEDNIKENTQKYYTFITFNTNLFSKLKLITGLRFDYLEMNSKTTISPRLGLSYSVSPITSVNFGYGRHYQSPNYNQIMYNIKVNKPNIDSKYSDHIVFGFEHYPTESIKMSVEIFKKNYSDIPIHNYYTMQIADTSQEYDDNEFFVNKQVARSTGIEFFVQKKMFDKWYGIMSYSYSKTEAKDMRYNKWYSWDYDYRNVLNLVAGYKIHKSKNQSIFKSIIMTGSDEFTFSVRYRYMGGRPYTKPTYSSELRQWYVDDTHFNTHRYPEYNRFDITFQWKTRMKNKYLVGYLNIQNILNIENIWEYAYNDDGTIEKILQYETFPVGGFILEF